jgi:hypothetical protein
MDGERVVDSHWFKQLVSRHRRVCIRAASDGLFVCVPQTCSLASWSVTARDVGAYVFWAAADRSVPREEGRRARAAVLARPLARPCAVILVQRQRSRGGRTVVGPEAARWSAHFGRRQGDDLTPSLPLPDPVPTTRAEHHVLAPSSKRGEFRTLSGRTVVISGAEIVTTSGFSTKVAAQILASPVIAVELPADSSSSSSSASAAASGDASTSAGPLGDTGTSPKPGNLRIYFISRPLEGGNATPSRVDELEPRGIRAYLGLLRSSPDAEPAFAELEAGVKEVLRLLDRPAPPSQRVAAAQAELSALCERVSALLLDTTTFDEESDDGVERARQQILQCLESWCAERLHDHALGVLHAELHSDVELLRAALSEAAAAGKTAASFGIKPLFDVDYTPAIARLAEMVSLRSPLEKLHCIRDASMLVHKCVESALEAAGTDLADVEMGADDILPILAWLILRLHVGGAGTAAGAAAGGAGGAAASATPTSPGSKGTPPSTTAAAAAFCPTASELPVHFAFIQRFHLPESGELDVSLLGYRLANLEQALNYFRQ